MDIAHPDLYPLYADHLATVKSRTDTALARAGRDHLVIAAGTPRYEFLDDKPYPFAVNPWFKYWVPVTKAPGSWLVYTPGAEAEARLSAAARLLARRAGRAGGLLGRAFRHRDHPRAGRSRAASAEGCRALRDRRRRQFRRRRVRCRTIPKALLDHLHYHRAYKTQYELAMMRVASKIGARAHRAAEAAFRAGESEFGIHMAYLAAARQTDNELPYSNIVALNEHGAVLHYTDLNHAPPAHGAFVPDRRRRKLPRLRERYHAHARGRGRGRIRGADRRRRRRAARFLRESARGTELSRAARARASRARRHPARPGLHPHERRKRGRIRRVVDVLPARPRPRHRPPGARCRRIPGKRARRHDSRSRRAIRTCASRASSKPGMVTTIEPGLYFIDMLLAELKKKPAAKDVVWDKVDAFRKYGGIRIEDDVVCTDDEPENLTRDAFARRLRSTRSPFPLSRLRERAGVRATVRSLTPPSSASGTFIRAIHGAHLRRLRRAKRQSCRFVSRSGRRNRLAA